MIPAGIRSMAGRRALSVLLLSAALAGAVPAANAATSPAVNDVRQLLEQYHLSKPTDATLKDDTIPGLIEALHDPYTAYYSAEEWRQLQSGAAEAGAGVGIVSARDGERLYVLDVVAGSPAAAAGIVAGDALVSANGTDVRTKSPEELDRLLIGKEGTTLTVAVSRGGRSVSYSLVRRNIQPPAARQAMLRGGAGYLALADFRYGSSSLFKQELAKLKAKGMRSLIVDLRDNGGGYVDEARSIAALFVRDGALAHLIGRDGLEETLAIKGEDASFPVFVLVNEGSASSSELLAGALQDYGVARLIGERTYGKGVVQQFVNVPSGGMLKVTVKEYTTPNGRKVDKTGLAPDVAVAGEAEQLLAAVRLAGGKPTMLLAGHGAVVVDGIRSAAAGTTTLVSGVPYVDLKLAAAFAGASVGYEASSRSIAFRKDGRVFRLPVGSAALTVKNGVSSVDVRVLAKWLPGLKWSESDGVLRLKLS